MKKTIVAIILIFLVLICSFGVVYAKQETLKESNVNDITIMREKVNTELEKYSKKYGSDAYGYAAYILNIVRWYSIPVCFIGIVVGALNQYVLGTRRLDRKHKGYGMVMTFVTLLVVCQVLPLIFTIVVIGWRG